MTDAVIVSTARTPIGKAYRGMLNATEGATLLGHAIGEAVARAKVDPKEIEDVVMGMLIVSGAGPWRELFRKPADTPPALIQRERAPDTRA